MRRGDKHLVNIGCFGKFGTIVRQSVLVPLDPRSAVHDNAAPPCGRGSISRRFRDDEGARAKRGSPRPSSPTSLAASPWCLFAAEGSPLDQPFWDPRPTCRPQALRSASKPTATHAFCRELSAQAFGPGRFARSAYRVREGVPPVQGAVPLRGLLDERLVGGIRFTAIRIGEGEGGASARAAGGRSGGERQRLRQGAGRGRLGAGARPKASRLVLLVGDMPYYGRFGFRPCRRGRSRCRVRSIPRVCSRLSLFPARSTAPRAGSRATRANGLRGTRWRPGGRATGRARGSR